jgi:hypothetical protein
VKSTLTDPVFDRFAAEPKAEKLTARDHAVLSTS